MSGFQDFSQTVRDYGDKEAKVLMNTVGNIHQPAGRSHLHQYADGRTYPTELDFRLYAGNVTRFGVRHFQRAYRTENFHCVIVVDAEKVKRGGKSLQEDTCHYRLHGRGR